LAHGGHLTHGHKVSATGIYFDQVAYGVDSKMQKAMRVSKQSKNDFYSLLENIISLLDSFVSKVTFKDMEIFDAFIFETIACLKDSIALNLEEATDYGLTTFQNLVISNRNQGRLMVLTEEIKGQVLNIRDYMNIDQNNNAINKTQNRLVEIKQIIEKKGTSLSEAERNNLTREAKNLLNRRTNYLSLNGRLQETIRARENQIDALQSKKQYESMVASQLLTPESYKETVAEINELKQTIDTSLEEADNISEVLYDDNISKKDAKVLTNSIEDLLKDVDSTSVEKEKVVNPQLKVEEKKNQELESILEDIEF
jgi:hypothetical protein